MKKKILSMAVVSVFMFSLLTGCSDSSSGDTEGSDGSDNNKSKVLTIAPDAWMVEKLHVQEAADYFEDQHPNIKVNIQPYPGKDALATFALDWAQDKTDVDVVMTDGLLNAVQFLSKDLLVDFNKTDFFQGKTAKENFVGETLSYANVNDTQYAIPISLETYAISINKKMFEEAGYVDDQGNIIPPKNWEEVYEYAKKMKKDGKEGMTIQWGPNGASTMLAVEVAANGTYKTDGVLSYDTPKMRDILKIWKKGVKDGTFSTQTFTDKDAGRNAYKAGQVAMVLESGSHAAEAAPLLGEDATGVVPIPGSDENGSYAFSAGILMPKASKNQDLAIQFIQEALMNQDIQTSVAQEWGKLPVLKEGFNKIDAQWKETLFGIIEKSQTAPFYSGYPVISKDLPVYLQEYLTGETDLDSFLEKVEKMISDIDKDV